MKISTVLILLLIAAAGPALCEDSYTDAVLRIDFANEKVEDLTSPACPADAIDITFTNISAEKMSNSNGHGAVFNGKTSGIELSGKGSEKLKIEGTLTYHIRVRFEDIANNQFLMGRNTEQQNISVLQIAKNSAWGYIVKNNNGKKSNDKIGYKTGEVLQAGKFYDIFLVFRPAKDKSSGGVRTFVFDAVSGKRIAISKNWGTTVKAIYPDSSVPLRIGNDESELSPLSGVVDQINVWNRCLSMHEMVSLSKPVLPDSFKTGVNRKVISASEQKKFPFYNDFESKDNCLMWMNYGRPYKVNFKGLTEEHAFSGKKSLKLDVNFQEPGRYIWSFAMPEVSPEGTSLSAYMLIGKESNARVSLGAAVQMKMGAASAKGYTRAMPHRNSTDGRWLKVDYGKTFAEDFGRFGKSMLDVAFHSFPVEYIRRDEVVPCMEKIIIDVIVKKAGERLVLYLDDLKLQNDHPADLSKIISANESKVQKRYDNEIKKLKAELAKAKRIIKDTDWPKSAIWVKDALNESIAKVDKELPTCCKKKNPFGAIAPEMEKIVNTLASLESLTQQNKVDHIFYLVNNLTSRNFWILPFDKLIPGTVDDRLFITACRGEYEPASLVVKALKDLDSLTVEPGVLVNAKEHREIPVKNIDVKLVKCWYQGASAGASINQKKSPVKLTPELLLNDPSLIKVDYEKEQNSLKLNFPDRVEYKDISTHKALKESVKNADCPVFDSPILLPVDVPVGQNQQFWITVKVPENAAPGLYKGQLKIIAKGKNIAALDLNVNVLPFELQKAYYTASIDYHGCPSETGSISSWAKTEEQMLAELKNLVAHGLTNCQHYFRATDESLEKVMQLRTKVGMSNDVLYLKGHGIYNGASTPEQLEKVRRGVSHIVKQAKKNGAKEVYFYGMDEVTGEKLMSQRKAWTAIRDAGGKIFVAGGRDNLVVMGDIQDMQVMAGWPDKQDVARWHKYGHKIFSYCNPQAGIEDPEVYRRNYGLLMWKYNYDGIADNAYQQSWGFAWNDFDHNTYRSCTFAYPTTNGVVDTISWEGYREAIDDVRYINTLQAMLVEAKKLQRPELKKQIASAENFIESLKNGNTIEGSNLDQLRRKIIQEILSLQSAIK